MVLLLAAFYCPQPEVDEFNFNSKCELLPLMRVALPTKENFPAFFCLLRLHFNVKDGFVCQCKRQFEEFGFMRYLRVVWAIIRQQSEKTPELNFFVGLIADLAI